MTFLAWRSRRYFVDKPGLEAGLYEALRPLPAPLPLSIRLALVHRLSESRVRIPLSLLTSGLLSVALASALAAGVWPVRDLNGGGAAAGGVLMLALIWWAISSVVRHSRRANSREVAYLLQLVQISDSARGYVCVLSAFLESPKRIDIVIAERLAARDFSHPEEVQRLVRSLAWSEIENTVAAST